MHETLISDGLRVISDSYLDHAEELCRRRNVAFERRLAEGANYVEILQEIAEDSRRDLSRSARSGSGRGGGA